MQGNSREFMLIEHLDVCRTFFWYLHVEILNGFVQYELHDRIKNVIQTCLWNESMWVRPCSTCKNVKHLHFLISHTDGVKMPEVHMWRIRWCFFNGDDVFIINEHFTFVRNGFRFFRWHLNFYTIVSLIVAQRLPTSWLEMRNQSEINYTEAGI